MPPHPPPCAANELQIGNTCYPRPDVLKVIRLGDGYSFLLGSVSPDLLPVLTNSSGDSAHMLVKNVGPAVDVTITSVLPDNAAELLRQLRPNDPDATLPD
ncbi:hypothetical protein AB9E06_34765 [Rhizobium leguminosarum]|uniref:hypothetical protein n=1 Tax=Rhizobium leguminosarum TaxID=384 RepID=UPI003F984F8C